MPNNRLKKNAPTRRWAWLSFCLYGAAAFMAAYLYVQLQLPDIHHIKHVELQAPLRVYTADKKLIGLFGEKYCFPTSIDNVPAPIIQAVIATEDQRFYQHMGIDVRGLMRAVYHLIRTGQKREGGSTITMQVARNLFLDQRKTYFRKIKEIALALKIDRLLSKQQILALYLNKVYFGHRAYGIKAAASIYYGKPLNQLSLAEMSMLAGLPKAPSLINPLRNPQRAIERRNHVLERMHAMGYITDDAYQRAIQTTITATAHLPHIAIHAPDVAEMVRLYAKNRWGDHAYTHDLQIYTTIDSHQQTCAEGALIRGALAYEAQYAQRNQSALDNGETNTEILPATPSVQAAIVSLDPHNGAIQALVGGVQAQHSQFNRVTQGKRQPGSAMKAFIYSAALDKGLTLATLINDAPIIMQGGGQHLLWRPHNDNDQFDGPTRLRVGLVHSRNLVSIRLLQRIGVHDTRHYLTRFGFAEKTLPKGLSLALGSNLTTPLTLATAYAVFANGGYRIYPRFIQTILQAGQSIPITPAQPAKKRVISPQNAYLMTHALRDVIQSGTGRRARSLNRGDIAGKTGTANDQTDAWFAGFNPNLVAVTWVGYDQARSLHAFASQTALPIWIDFMQQVLADSPMGHFPRPPGLTTVRIDPKTGKLANSAQENAIFETFRDAYLPKSHANIQINPQTSHKETLLENLF